MKRHHPYVYDGKQMDDGATDAGGCIDSHDDTDLQITLQSPPPGAPQARRSHADAARPRRVEVEVVFKINSPIVTSPLRGQIATAYERSGVT